MNLDSIIAHIKSLSVEIQHSNFKDIPVLKTKVLSLYEQLVLLENVDANIVEDNETNIKQVEEKEEISTSIVEPSIEIETVLKEELEDLSIEELILEEPKDISTTAPIEEEQIEEIDESLDGPELLHELESITEGFELPEFEPAPTLNTTQELPKSLNELLNKSVQIGLNDRIAFINHLFDKSQEDYTRVISQLNTMETPEEIVGFINSFVKPEYHHWEGKEAIEERFVQVVLKRFEA